MRYVQRLLEEKLRAAARSFPSVVLTGPRRAGKTMLLRHTFPKASYQLLESPEVIANLKNDPVSFLDALHPPVILDEIQNVPEVFNYVRARIDQAPRRTGQWFLTGSQEAGLMRGVTESMAGRSAIFGLWPMSIAESQKVSVLRGGFPEVLARPRTARLWFSSYLQTYLERDVRSITAVHDLATFRRFLAVVATRHGQILNKTELAAPLGMSVPGIGKWLDILEATGQILVVPPYFENLGKRITKAPKIYISDSGLACHLLGIDVPAELEKSPFLGAIFEGFVATEIVKAQLNAGRRKELYFFRDQQGLEVDFVLPGKGGHLSLIEVKSGKTVRPSMATSLQRLHAAFRNVHPRREASMWVVHRGAKLPTNVGVGRGVRALPYREFLEHQVGE